MAEKRFRSILLFGPPGVGKGTQGGIMGQVPGFFHLSTGDVFRSIDIGSTDGKEVYQHTSKGELVPNDLTIKIWKKALNAYIALSRYKPREDLLILDGIPRNKEQTALIAGDIEIMKIIHLQCSDEEDMIHRIRRRAIRENRADDANEDVIRHRFDVYRTQSAPVLDCYPDDLIEVVDANGSPAEVLRSIMNSVIPAQNRHFESVW